MELTTCDWARCSRVWYRGQIYTLHKINIYGRENNTSLKFLNFKGWHPAILCKPILRRFEDMTEDEIEMAYEIDRETCEGGCSECNINDFAFCKTSLKMIDYLDNIGIDQRGWIDSGLAVDEKEVIS